MNFRKPKYQVLADIESRVYTAVYREMDRYNGSPVASVKEVIQQAIIQGISEAMEELINSTYTDEEFEADLGLKT